MEPSPQTPADRIVIVRALWDAVRDRDIDAGMALIHDDVEWFPLMGEGGPLRGTEALRQHFERLAGAGLVTDAYPLDFEDVGDGRVLVSGALRVRRPDHWLETLQRWFVYVIADGRVRRAEACGSREEALATPRS